MFFFSRVCGCLLISHLSHGLLEENCCSSFHCLPLDVLHTCIDVELHCINVVGMSCSEVIDSGTNKSEERLQEEFVHNFGAHERTKGKLQPNEQAEFEKVIERDDGEDPADVHVSHH